MPKVATHSQAFQQAVAYLIQRFSQLPDCRTGDNKFIKMKDIGLSAFSVFFTQCASFLQYQKALQRRCTKNNAASLFGIEHIPSDNHIRHLLDPVLPSEIFPVYDFVLKTISQAVSLDTFRGFNHQLLVAVDGVYYFSSKEISCQRCSQKQHKNGDVTYSHSMLAATIVNPEKSQVLPLKPEFIEPQDGHNKQDCEREAMKRWLRTHGQHYAKMGVTLLGDDLFCCQPICHAVLAAGFQFIFTCKRDSHKCLYEWVDPLEKTDDMKTVEQRIKQKGKDYHYKCRYVNSVPLRNGNDAMNVNWCAVEVFNKQGKRLYQGAFATSHLLTDDNVVSIAQSGRSRWKIENEHNNTLKNHGYHLEHNFGHGKAHLASVLVTLILLSFLFHTMLNLLDERYRAIREDLPRYMFFQQLKTLLFYMYFASWDTLMEYMFRGCELEALDTS